MSHFFDSVISKLAPNSTIVLEKSYFVTRTHTLYEWTASHLRIMIQSWLKTLTVVIVIRGCGTLLYGHKCFIGRESTKHCQRHGHVQLSNASWCHCWHHTVQFPCHDSTLGLFNLWFGTLISIVSSIVI